MGLLELEVYCLHAQMFSLMSGIFLGIMMVYDVSAHPQDIQATWKVARGSGQWIDDPSLEFVCDDTAS